MCIGNWENSSQQLCLFEETNFVVFQQKKKIGKFIVFSSCKIRLISRENYQKNNITNLKNQNL
jgi:hypothetical protein